MENLIEDLRKVAAKFVADYKITEVFYVDEELHITSYYEISHDNQLWVEETLKKAIEKKPIETSSEQKSKGLEEAWRKELHERGVSDKSKALQQKLYSFNKKHFPVVIERNEGVDMFTREKYSYGNIDFSNISGWADRETFHSIKSGMYEPNEIGRKIEIQMSRGGGSAHYNFSYTDENVRIAKSTLEQHGYKVEVKGRDLSKANSEFVKGVLIKEPVFRGHPHDTLELTIRDENKRNHRIVFFKQLADRYNDQHLQKGDKVSVVGTNSDVVTMSNEGSIQVVGWDQKWIQGSNLKVLERNNTLQNSDISRNQMTR